MHLNNTDEKLLLERLELSRVKGEGYNQHHGCMLQTRVVVLKNIINWVLKPSDPHGELNLTKADNIFWLYGMPGQGKTAVANSLCDRLHQMKRLGGSFFCRRDD